MFLDFLNSRGETPYKRVPKGFFDKVCVLIFPLKTEYHFIFMDFLDSRGGEGTLYKRVPESFVDDVCVLIFSP